MYVNLLEPYLNLQAEIAMGELQEVLDRQVLTVQRVAGGSHMHIM